MKVFYCKDSKEGRVTTVSLMGLETLSGKSCDLCEYGLPTFNNFPKPPHSNNSTRNNLCFVKNNEIEIEEQNADERK
jgi:hypothetical protein